jgi:O-antigen ligase
MTDLSLTAPPRAAARRTFDYNKLLDGVFFLSVAAGSIVFIEPSPSDILILLNIGLWILGGFRVHRAVIPHILFLELWVLGGFIGLVPYWNEDDPVSFMFHTLFITTTGLFYALFLAERTSRRLELLLNGYVISCVIAAIIAVLTWYGFFGDSQLFIQDSRAMAPTKDPNVLGTFLIMGVLILVQRLLLGNMRLVWLVLPSLAIIVTALFLTFSRGSWGATVISTMMIVAFLIKTADTAKMRLRIIAGATAVVLAASLALISALSIDSIHDYFFERASVTQDYDEGPNGRFGNQLRSIPMLLERPLGFGPLRFRLIFGLEPHNSYINAFASNGWLGGFSFIMMVLSTCYVGFRQCVTRHPWNRQAQILFSATFVFFLQGFQIDIDHWRMFYLTLGAVWGIEAARCRWLTQNDQAQQSFDKNVEAADG